LYEDDPYAEEKEPLVSQTEIFAEEKKNIFSYKGKYLIISLKSGLTLINQRRAHIRVLFDEFMERIRQRQGISQGLLFPEIISFTPGEATILPFLLDDLAYIGFDLCDLGNNSYSINGVPAGLENFDAVETLQEMTGKVIETGCEIKEEITEALALALAKRAAISHDKFLPDEDAGSLVAKLFASSMPNYTPDGKPIVSILSDDEISKRFK
jgi:DNA mismatch repair protein MutL